MSQILATAAAQTGNPPEFTAFVGILGAVVGGAIGLFGQRLNIREQRRKDLRERVLDLLQETEGLRVKSNQFLSAIQSGKARDAGAMVDEMRIRVLNLTHIRNHLEVTAPSKVKERTYDLARVTQKFNDQVLDYLVDSFEGNDSEQAMASIRTAEETLQESARNLVSYMRKRHRAPLSK